MTTMTITRHLLRGLRPEPLASYLAGLGLIRVLGEQVDKEATAAWTPDGLAITTHVQDLAQWLADEYQPAPVLSPWNGSSGFGAKDKEPVVRLAAIREHPSPRLAKLREGMKIAESVVRQGRERGWITEKGVADKRALVLEFRNRCPEELVPWIDAAVVLTPDDPKFPPILGTGGNDGHLEFSSNFHEQLLVVIGKSDKDRVRSLSVASDLLSGTQVERLVAAPIGQFAPGSAGGPGSSRFGSAESLTNAWGYVLCFEGALLFAASAVKRNLHAAGEAAMPFTVQDSPDGSVSGSAGEESHGEVWVPIWTHEFTLIEIKQLFAEARASWRGRPARQAVDFYAATRTLGVARGIDEFRRFGMHKRNGRSFTAVPLDRVVVRERPAVQLSAKIEDWVKRVGGSEASRSVAEVHRGFQKAHLEFARDGDEQTLAAMLAALTTLEMAVGRSGRAKDAVQVRHTPRADGGFLKVLAEIDECELRVAVGLASCATWPVEGPRRSMRHILLPVDPADPGGQPRWRDAPLVPGFGARPLADVLADVLIWRSRTAGGDHNANGFRGVPTFPSGIGVPAADLHALAADRLDGAKLDLYLRACLALNWRNVKWSWTAAKPDVPVTTLALLHPLAVGFRQGNPREVPDNERVPALGPEWASRLASGQRSQVQTVHREAADRLRQAGGWTPVPAPPDNAIPARAGIRIAAALVPRCLNPRAALRMVAFDPDTDEAIREDAIEESDANPQPEQSEQSEEP